MVFCENTANHNLNFQLHKKQLQTDKRCDFMTTFGLLTCKKGTPPKHITHLAEVALQYPIEVVCFCPSNIQPITHEVIGYTFDKQKKSWIASTFSLPNLLYDRCFYNTKEERMQNAAVVKWLQTQKNIIFLNHSLPNKIEVYEFLQTICTFKPFLPNLQKLEKTSDCIKNLNLNGQILLQPEANLGTAGQILCKQIGTQYQLQTIRNKKIIKKTVPSMKELEAFLDSLIQKKSYILSPMLTFYTKNRNTFLLRFLLQKDGNGLWCTKGKMAILHPEVRWDLSKQKEKTIHFQAFINHNFPRNFRTQLRSMQNIIQKLPAILDQHFQSQFELVIDMGIDYQLQPVLVNWNHKPTPKMLEQIAPHCDFPIDEAPIVYGLYLTKNESRQKDTKRKEN